MSFDLFNLPAPAISAPQRPQVGHGYKLSWCQREDCDVLSEALHKGYRKPACVGATGYGKGPMIAEMCGRLVRELGPGVVLVDRANLVEQLADAIEFHLGFEVGRVADGAMVGIDRSIVVSTVQAMYTKDRGGQPLHEHLSITERRWVAVDEAHKFFAPCFRAVPEHFVDNNGARVVLFTATPVAANGDDWRSFADWTAIDPGPCNRTIQWCVDSGLLVPMRQAYIHAQADVSKVYAKLGEVDADDEREDAGDELASVLIEMLTNRDERSAMEFASAVKEAIGEDRAMIFAPPKVEALKLLVSWLKHSVSCDGVWGARPNKGEILKSFRRGYPQALVSVNMLCEGADFADVSKGFVFRAIKKNWRLTTQIVGRTVRIHPSIQSQLRELDGPENSARRRALIAASPKPVATIYDLVGMDGRALQSSVVEALAGDRSEDLKRTMGELLTRAAANHKTGLAVDKDLIEEAAKQLQSRQNDELFELARRRAMVGDMGADVMVAYDEPGVVLPGAPVAKHMATLGEKARWVAMALQYDVDRAKGIAERTPRHVLRGMACGAQKKLQKENKSPDWRRARQAYPEWANQKRAS